jgi:prostaglandin-E synthase
MSNPTILWAQDRDTVFVTIQVEEIKEHDIKINNNKITFKGKNKTNQYNLEINLFTDINIEKSNSAIYATDIKLKLRKNHSLFWPRLTKTKQNNIKIDWSKWVCEDDEDESDENINPLPGGHSFEDFKKQIPNEILEKDFSELFGNNNEEISDND